MIKLVAFFGNPGPQYADNRHNAGWHLARVLPFYDSLSWQKKFKGLSAALDGGRLVSALRALSAAGIPPGDIRLPERAGGLPETFHLLLPLTFMNLSGESVFQAASFYKIKLEEILVVHDELEIPLGTISLKFSGGLGGHNGLRSMKACFGSADCWRLRIGIGRPAHDDISGWVLSDFTAEEHPALRPALAAGAELLLRALADDPAKLLPAWAKKKIPVPAPDRDFQPEEAPRECK